MQTKTALSRIALTDQVTHLVQERILDRVYQPGARLNIDALCREFDVSSSPIREALTQLVGAGLTVSVSFAGFSVTPLPSRTWFEQLRDFRILAEGWAVRSVARLRPPATLSHMADTLKEMQGQIIGKKARSYLSICRTDETFHNAILDACGNDVLAQGVRSLRPHLQHARLFSQVPQDIKPVIQEHRALLDAIIVGEEDRAAAALRNHLLASWKRYDAWSEADESK